VLARREAGRDECVLTPSTNTFATPRLGPRCAIQTTSVPVKISVAVAFRFVVYFVLPHGVPAALFVSHAFV
jgi:hypothetical protein